MQPYTRTLNLLIPAIVACALALMVGASDEVKSEIELQAEPIGIDYTGLEAAVLEGNPEALRVFLALLFDGGGGEIFQDEWRPRTLRLVSDEDLHNGLSIFSPEHRKQIVASMISGLTGTELEALKHRFPKSFAMTSGR